mmetsp:Transcript_64315/g.153386  ORF Transcript_64315/g.153386 Transcript_64315/m.153386 type:complete len:869 (-) Transcript_64315:226-2832(-)
MQLARKTSFAKTSADVDIGESLDSLDRARQFGNSKLSLQRLVFVHELVESAHEVGYGATVEVLLPMIWRLVGDPEALVRKELIQQFGSLAGFLIQADPENGYDQVAKDLLPITQHLLLEKSVDVRMGAVEAFVTLASHMRCGNRAEQALMVVIELAHREDDDARCTACELFAALPEILGSELCQVFVGIELAALCLDPSTEVRTMVTASFADVCREIGPEQAMQRLIPAFVRLAEDAQWSVRRAVADNIAGVVGTLPSSGDRARIMVPVIQKLLADEMPNVQAAASRQLGYIIAVIGDSKHVPEEFMSMYVSRTALQTFTPDVAFHWAYTFAGVVKAMGGTPELWTVMGPLFRDLCRSGSDASKKALASSLHIILESLVDPLSKRDVVVEMESLILDLRDRSEVKVAALRNFPAVLRAAIEARVRVNGLILALQALFGAESQVRSPWRWRQILCTVLPSICNCISSVLSNKASSAAEEMMALDSGGQGLSELAWNAIVPLFLQLASDEVAAVREAAAGATAAVLRVVVPEFFGQPGTAASGEGSSGGSGDSYRGQLPQASLKLLRRLVCGFAKCRTHMMHRQTYIRMCDAVIRYGPVGPRMSMLLRPLADLATDRTKNISLLWAQVLAPHLRKSGKLGKHQQLVSVAQGLLESTQDAEVRRVLKEVQMHADVSALEADPDWDDLELQGELLESESAEPLAEEGGTGNSAERKDLDVAVEPPKEPGQQESPSSPGSRLPIEAMDTAWPCPAGSTTKLPANALGNCSDAGGGRQAEPQSGHQAHRQQPGAYDPVEDSLVLQAEVDRERDEKFAAQRLVVEAEAAGALSSSEPSSALVLPPSHKAQDEGSPKVVPQQQPAQSVAEEEDKEA